MWEGVVLVVNIVAPLIAFGMFIPQAVQTWKIRKNPEKLSAISPGTQWLILLNATLWFVLAVDLQSFAVGAPGFVNAPLAIATLALIYFAKLSEKRRGRESLLVTKPLPIPVEISVNQKDAA